MGSGDRTKTALAAADTDEAGQAASYLTSQVIRRGALIDRYLVLDELGAGGMGVVHAAYDPQLDRKVAIKLVRDGEGAGSSARRDRLLREARAMARLDHHNVVRVFDAGTTRIGGTEQVFVTMELVDGEPLGAWAKGRGWREILGALIAAGRGLAVAHAAGVVHRDFKPDNVLVDRTGRARVGDFGLATPAGEMATPDATSPPDDLTQTGAIMGTPAFMAPEQHRGDPVDARADQFAFCVTAWLLLYRTHPFAGEPLRECGGWPGASKRRHARGSRADRSVLRAGSSEATAARHPSLTRLSRRARAPAASAALAAARRCARSRVCGGDLVRHAAR